MNTLIRTGTLVCCLAAGLTATLATTLSAQSLHDRAKDRPNVTVRMAYPARAGICAGDTYASPGGYLSGGSSLSAPEWSNGCSGATVHTAVQFRDGRVVSIRWYAGGEWNTSEESILDLGALSADDAAKLLIDAALDNRMSSEGRGVPNVGPRVAGPDVRWAALSAAGVASGVSVGKRLMTIVDNRVIPAETRSWALGMLPQADRERMIERIIQITLDKNEPVELRESAARTLSASREGPGRAALMKILGTPDVHPRVLKVAVQSLSASKDPEVVALLERLLTQQ